MALVDKIREAFQAVAADIRTLFARSPTTVAELLANTKVLPSGFVITTQSEGYSYQVSPTPTVIIDAGGNYLKPIPIKNKIHMSAYGNMVDFGPAFREARNILAPTGGCIVLEERTYNIGGTETRNYWGIQSESSGINAISIALYLPAGVSIVGPEDARATISRSGGGISAIIALENYGNGKLRNLIVQGPGGTGNTMHGIASFVTSNAEHVIDGLVIENVTCRNVGSYGIGQQYSGQRRCVVRNVETENTGSDGIDWKIRGPNGQQTPTETVYFENIRVKTFGLRITGQSSTGLGIRGQARLKGIWIYDIAPGQVGLQLAPGVNDTTRGDLRKTAFYSEVDGVYCEGRDARSDPVNPAIAVQAFAVDRVLIANVVAKHCILSENLAGTSPPAQLHGPVWDNCLVIPPHNVQWAAELYLKGTTMDITVQSDYDWFDVRAGTATVGQTAFTLPRGAPTANYAVVRNGVRITSGFSVSGSTLTVTTGIGDTETICVVYPAQRAVRVMGDYAVITGSCDEYTPLGVNYQSQSHVDTGNALGFVARGKITVADINSQVETGISSRGDAANIDLFLRPKGNGRAKLVRPALVQIPTAATGLPSGALWNDGGTVKIAP